MLQMGKPRYCYVKNLAQCQQPMNIGAGNQPRLVWSQISKSYPLASIAPLIEIPTSQDYTGKPLKITLFKGRQSLCTTIDYFLDLTWERKFQLKLARLHFQASYYKSNIQVNPTWDSHHPLYLCPFTHLPFIPLRHISGILALFLPSYAVPNMVSLVWRCPGCFWKPLLLLFILLSSVGKRYPFGILTVHRGIKVSL